MKKVLFAIGAGLALAGFQSVLAEAPVATAPVAKECAQCPVSKAMEAFPKLTYKVGDRETCCDKEAAKLAESSEGHIHFVVAGKEFHAKEKAYVALADVSEKFVKDYVTPHTCKESGKTTVCGANVCCEVHAGTLAKKAQAAAKTVAMSYKVGDEKCDCPTQATALAKESGAKKEFVVGKETTCCSIDARVKLARAQYQAAVKAVQGDLPKQDS